jgi:hypothetical protein
MDGWTLSTIHDPSDPDLADAIDVELMRIANGAPGYPCVRPLPDDDLLPPYRVRVGDDSQTVICDSPGLRDALEEMPTGAPVDVVWRELLVWVLKDL